MDDCINDMVRDTDNIFPQAYHVNIPRLATRLGTCPAICGSSADLYMQYWKRPRINTQSFALDWKLLSAAEKVFLVWSWLLSPFVTHSHLKKACCFVYLREPLVPIHIIETINYADLGLQATFKFGATWLQIRADLWLDSSAWIRAKKSQHDHAGIRDRSCWKTTKFVGKG